MTNLTSFEAIERLLLVVAGAFLAVPSRATVFTVANTNDSGAGSLRQAILDANAAPGADTIAFALSGPGVHTITPLSTLPALTDNSGVTIDGYTQPGSAPNSLNRGTNAVLRVELSGPAGQQSGTGLLLRSSANVVRGLVIN